MSRRLKRVSLERRASAARRLIALGKVDPYEALAAVVWPSKES
jgi:hypothetical protein